MGRYFLGLLGAVTLLAVLTAGCGMAVPSPGSQPAAASNPAQNRAGTGQPAGGTNANIGRPPSLSATVVAIFGQSVSIRTADGPDQILIGDQTQYRKVEAVSLASLKAGDTIVARGEALEGGAMLAQMVQIVPERTGPGGAGAEGPPRQQPDASGASGPAGGSTRQRPAALADGSSPPQGGAGGAPQGRGLGQGTGAGGGAAGPGVPGQGPQDRSGQSALTGVVRQIDGKSITLTTPDGVRTVAVDDATQVQRVLVATRADLKIGEAVTVMWTVGTDAGATVSAITIGGR